jgi:hypothetical protein
MKRGGGTVSDVLEEALTRALHQVVPDRAPPPPSDLAAEAARESTRRTARRARLMVVAAAVAVLVVVTGGAVTVDRLRSDSSVPATPSNFRDGAPLAEVYPKAVRKLPKTMPNGQSYRVMTPLPGGRYLVGSLRSPKGKNSYWDAFWSWDLAGGKPSLLVRLPYDDQSIIASVAVGDKWLAWSMSLLPDGSTTLWAVPVDGGTAHQFLSLAPSRHAPDPWITSMAVDGDTVAYGYDDLGVYTIPVTGGTPKMVPSSVNYEILQWPWLGGTLLGHPGLAGTFARNAKTGDVLVGHLRMAPAPKGGGDQGSCSLSWCVRLRGTTFLSELRNGAQPWTINGVDAGFPTCTSYDRFVFITRGKGKATTLLLLDLQRRKYLTVGSAAPYKNSQGETESPWRAGRGSLAHWTDGPGKNATEYLIDLAAIK